MQKVHRHLVAGSLGLCIGLLAHPLWAQGDPSGASQDTPAAYVDKVQVRNVTVGKDTLDRPGVFGEIKNGGTHTLSEVEITIYCLDASGTSVFEKKYHPVLAGGLMLSADTGTPLKPNYSRKFGVKMDDAPSEWAKKAKVKVTAVEFADAPKAASSTGSAASVPSPNVPETADQKARREEIEAKGKAACGTCAGGMFVLIAVPVVILILNIVLLVWVARDAKARGMDSAVVWMILVMLTSVLGLIIYLFSRPKGNLILCPHCRNKRLAASAKCPHCGNA